jgi:hypothetical protein
LLMIPCKRIGFYAAIQALTDARPDQELGSSVNRLCSVFMSSFPYWKDNLRNKLLALFLQWEKVLLAAN